MSEEERQFLVDKYQKSYGTASSFMLRKPFKRTVRHPVQASDTLQGICVRYRSSMVEIKRLNRLFNADSLLLLDYVLVPIYEDEDDSAVDDNQPSCSSSHNNNCDNKLLRNSSSASLGTAPPREADPQISCYDILSRIDSSTRSVARNVQKLASRIDSLDEALTPTSSKHGMGDSFSSLSLTSQNSLDPPVDIPSINHVSSRKAKSRRRAEQANSELPMVKLKSRGSRNRDDEFFNL